MSNEMKKSRKRGKKKLFNKINLAVICLALVLLCSVGGTFAFLIANTDGLTNTFLASKVTSEVEEEFDGTYKSEVNVRNTGETEAYVRIKLISYRVNADGDRIGGTTEIVMPQLGEGWIKKGEHYYYIYPVAPGDTPDKCLTGNGFIELKDYSQIAGDPDGGKQVIEVMAEAIQSKPMDAVEAAWPEAKGIFKVTSTSSDSGDEIILE